MKDALFFHIRNGGNDQNGLRPHTYCVIKKEQNLYIGYSIVHENDQFCRKTGRDQAQKIAVAATTIKDEHFSLQADPEYPQSIRASINDVVQKAGEILEVTGKVYVNAIIRGKTKKVPVSKIFEVVKTEKPA